MTYDHSAKMVVFLFPAVTDIGNVPATRTGYTDAKQERKPNRMAATTGYNERELARLFGDLVATVECGNCDGDGGYFVEGTAGPGSRLETPPDFWQFCTRCKGRRDVDEDAWQFVARVTCKPGDEILTGDTVAERLCDTVAALLSILESGGLDPDPAYRFEILKRLRPRLARAVTK